MDTGIQILDSGFLIYGKQRSIIRASLELRCLPKLLNCGVNVVEVHNNLFDLLENCRLLVYLTSQKGENSFITFVRKMTKLSEKNSTGA